MFDFVGKKQWFFLVSAIVILAGIISLSLPGALRLGIAFRGGTAVTLAANESVTLDDVRQKVDSLGFGDAVIQAGELGFYVRLAALSPDGQAQLKAVLEELGLVVQGIDSVSPSVALETISNAAIAVGVAMLVILLYVTLAFRKAPHPFRWGVCAIVALIHDVLVIFGAYSILSRIFGWDVDPMVITATLAVIGYSINDTVVVFDRMREHLRAEPTAPFASLVNASLYETLGRSLCTSLTTLFAVMAIFLFIGGNIVGFALVLLVGIVSGTYSSIFIAAQLLVIWERQGAKGFLPQKLFARAG